MATRTRDTKRVERLLALTQEKRKLLREEIHAGASLQAEYDSETAEEQKYSDRLKELKAHNARIEAEARGLGFKSNAEREAKEAADAKAKAEADEQAAKEAAEKTAKEGAEKKQGT